MSSQLPEVTRVYQNHHLDSTRWEFYTPHENDVIVTTSYKSGTTWVQMILYQLIYGKNISKWGDVTCWLDGRFESNRTDLSKWMTRKERRFIKTHLPLDALPYYPQVKYIILGRDSRDVFMSWFNHYSNYTEHAYNIINETPALVGEQLVPCPEDPREAWRSWITRGWFEWESEGYPWWGNMRHTQTYWEFKYLPNFLFIHYNDLLKDIQYCVRKIAKFIEIDADDDKVFQVIKESQFSAMKNTAKQEAVKHKDTPQFFNSGSDTFFFKGTNDRWKGILTKEDLELYEEAKNRVLTVECANWLENC
jgi:aryl sulfotransferase